MEEKKYPLSGQTIEDKEHRANPQAVAPAEQPAGNADVDDDAATAEEMEAFIRDRREKEKRSKIKDDDADEVDIFGEYMAPENSIDPYLEPHAAAGEVRRERVPVARLQAVPRMLCAGQRDRDAQLQQGDVVQLDARHPPAGYQAVRLCGGAL